jgi:hypothetical protein
MHAHQLIRLAGCLVILNSCISVALSAERPTFNKATRDPRPDILPYWLMEGHFVDYRRIFNRPTHLGGWVAHAIEPISQEAMVWKEAKCLGLYRPHHQPALRRYYYAPKPWERLLTGPRPDNMQAAQSALPSSPAETLPSAGEPILDESIPDESILDESSSIRYLEELQLEEK